MSAPSNHARRENLDTDYDDPVEKMLERTGCAKQHYALQDCMADKKDWRACQDNVAQLRKCMEAYQASTQPKTQNL